MTVLLAQLASVVHATNFERKADLDEAGCEDVQWTVDAENKELLLSWKSKESAEWTAFGISDFGTMKGADMIIVKQQGSSFVVEDRYSTEKVTPELDILQNVELMFAGYDEENRLAVVVRRSLDTCDGHDIAVQSHQQYIVCSSGDLDDGTGEISYHGSQRSSGVTNFLVEEDLLFNQAYQAPANVAPIEEISEGVVVWGNISTATSPFALDIQLQDVNLKPGVVTSYICSAFWIPQDFRFTTVEDVWGNGETTSAGKSNPASHHMHLHYCEDESQVDPSHRDGTKWNCFDEMPKCGIKASYAIGTGRNSVPSGLHFDLPQGLYILQVHYENPFHRIVENDRTGMRLWVQPPAVSSSTNSAGLIQFDALHDSIHIPKDPLQKEVVYQFQISSTATREFLPSQGILFFGSLFHMHNLGAWGKVEVVRDGSRVATVYKSMSYDYDRQVVSWNRWKLLPGDAVIVTCAYKPLPDKDVFGGFGTKDEMCGVHSGTSPAIPNLGRAMGAFVKLDEPFLNSYMGPASVNSRLLNYSSYVYPPDPLDRSYDTTAGYSDNICHTMTRSKMIFSTFHFSEGALAAQLVLMFAFCFTRVLSLPRVMMYIGIEHLDVRDRRNTIVYIGHILFSFVTLPSAVVTLVYILREKRSFDAVNPQHHIFMLGLMTMLVLLYFAELFYRIRVRPSLVAHHVLTSGAMLSLYAFESRMYSDLAFKYGLILQVLAYTEQPLYVSMFLRNVGFQERKPASFVLVCKWAIRIFLASRLVVLGLFLVVLQQNVREGSTAWRLREESFSDWWNYPNTAVNAVMVNVVMVLFLVGIMFANWSAVAALRHMARNKRPGNRVSSRSEDDSIRTEREPGSFTNEKLWI